MTDPIHSPLGASSAERWMNCPGSVKLIKSIVPLPEPEDPEYRKEGTAAHAVIAHCLSGSCPEPWEVVGDTFEGVVVTSEMADAVQVFVNECNALAAGAEEIFVEEHLKGEHPQEYGTVDFGAVHPGILYVRDYKHGQGIVVATEGNQQMLYYAHLLLLKRPDVRKVNMKIVQPRVPYRNDEAWEVTAEYVFDWANEKLLPAMARTETDDTLLPGEHCRFCDAKGALACPALKALYQGFEGAQPTVATYDDSLLVKDWQAIAPVKMHIKALEGEVIRRLMSNGLVDNGVCKLVNQKANRVWKPEATEVFTSRFGAKVMNPPEFKSPAEMEKIDPTAKKMVHEYAYTPQSGYTVAALDDKRPGVKIQQASETFKGAIDSAADL